MAKNFANSCGVAAAPMSRRAGYPCSAATVGVSDSTAARANIGLSVDIGYAPITRNCPALDGVEMVDGAERSSETADIYQLFQARLDVARLIGRSTLQDRRLSIPEPGKSESGRADGQHGVLQRGQVPSFAAIRRHFHTRNPTASTPGKPGDLIEAWTGKLHLAGRKGDHRFALHGEAELAGFSVGEQIGVFRCFLARHERLVAQFEPPQPFDMGVALPSGQNQAERIALLGP